MNGQYTNGADATQENGRAQDPIQQVREQVLAAQRQAQQCVEAAIAGARKIVENELSNFRDTLGDTEQFVDRNQKEVEKAFEQARAVVEGTFEQFANPAPPENGA